MKSSLNNVLIIHNICLSISLITEKSVLVVHAHRFSTEKYNMMYLDNKFSHLTNTSLNKLGPAYFLEKERIGAG